MMGMAADLHLPLFIAYVKSWFSHDITHLNIERELFI